MTHGRFCLRDLSGSSTNLKAGGLIPDSSSLQAEVTLGKILNSKFSISIQCVCVNVRKRGIDKSSVSICVIIESALSAYLSRKAVWKPVLDCYETLASWLTLELCVE